MKRLVVLLVAMCLHAGTWTMGSFGHWANPDGTVYPDSKLMVAKTVYVGKMMCSARLLSWDYVQTWCVKEDGRVINHVDPLYPDAVLTTDIYDNRPGEVDASILWLLAYVEGNPRTVGYQISYGVRDGSDGQMSNRPYLSGQF